jgi:hypothetical protein
VGAFLRDRSRPVDQRTVNTPDQLPFLDDPIDHMFMEHEHAMACGDNLKACDDLKKGRKKVNIYIYIYIYIKFPIESAEKIGQSVLFSDNILSQPSGDKTNSSSNTKTRGLLSGQVEYLTKLITVHSTSMHTFMNKRGPCLAPRERACVAALQLHVLNAYISCLQLVSSHVSPTQPHNISNKMTEMVSLCEEPIPSISDGIDAVDQRTSFCLDSGHIVPL